MPVVYMDDTYLQGDSFFISCQQNVYANVNLLQNLGFNVNDINWSTSPLSPISIKCGVPTHRLVTMLHMTYGLGRFLTIFGFLLHIFRVTLM